MGCGQKAWHDDEEDWDFLKRTHNIEDVRWDVYSTEASIAKEMVNSNPLLKGPLLKLDVVHETNLRALKHKQQQERKDFVAALELMKKFT
jgi:hypothetical protein